MTNELSVPGMSVPFLVISAVLCLVGPIVLWLCLRERIRLREMLFGLVTYLVMAYFAEGMIIGLLGESLSPVVYALAVAVIAALLEEGSRFLVMKKLMQSPNGSADPALGFGFGFALFELVGVGVNAMMTGVVLYTLQSEGLAALTADSEGDLDAFIAELEALVATSPGVFLLGGINRIFFTASQLGLSVLVWYAAKREGSIRLLPLAMLLSALCALPTLLYNGGVVEVQLYAEIAYWLLALVTALIAARLFKQNETSYYLRMPGERLRVRKR